MCTVSDATCRLSQIADAIIAGAFSTRMGRLPLKTLRASSTLATPFLPAISIPGPALLRNLELSMRTLTIFCDVLSGSRSMPALGRVPLVLLKTEFVTSTPLASTMDSPWRRLLSAVTPQNFVSVAPST